MKKNRYYSVLTGDIIGFSKYSQVEKRLIQNTLNNIANKINNFGNIGFKYINVFRGDSWQILLSNPEKSLFATIFVRAFLKSSTKINNLNTRISIAIDTIDFPGNKDTAGDGKAFRLSGSNLDKMNIKSDQLIFYSGNLDYSTTTAKKNEINIIFGFIDSISSNWTSKQSEVIIKSLEGLNVREIADDLKISSSTINEHQVKAAWKHIKAAIDYFEELFS